MAGSTSISVFASSTPPTCILRGVGAGLLCREKNHFFADRSCVYNATDRNGAVHRLRAPKHPTLIAPRSVFLLSADFFLSGQGLKTPLQLPRILYFGL